MCMCLLLQGRLRFFASLRRYCDDKRQIKRTFGFVPVVTSMDTMELDFSNSGTVLIEKYTVNQLVYIARCMKEKKRTHIYYATSVYLH